MKPYNPVALGPHGLDESLTITLLSPSDTNATDKLIDVGYPIKRGANDTLGNLYGALCADGDVYPFIAEERVDKPDWPFTVRVVPNAKAGLPPAGRFVRQMKYTGAAGSGLRSTVANGAGGVRLVAGAGVAAVLRTGVVASNNAIDYTARQTGPDANAINIVLVDPAGASQTLKVAVVNRTITVSLATNGSSVITSTAAQVIAAINADPVASGLVSAANASTSNGTGVVAAAASAPLAGGAAGIGQVMDNPTTSGGTALVLY